MPISIMKIKQSVESVKIGAVPSEGGSRERSVIIGGEETMPFLSAYGKLPNKPLVAYEIWDTKPEDWCSYLEDELEQYMDNPEKWGNYLIHNLSAQLIHIRIMSVHPDYGQKSPSEAAGNFKKLLNDVKIPMIVTGCGVSDIDKELMPLIAEAAKGEKLLLGNATAENYREITKACIDFGHNLITESPIDINIAKQVNILVSEAGLPADRVVMYATTGALGYGLEYAYSIMEKTRLAGLEGDKYMNRPQIAFVGQETWRAKEAVRSKESGINWEVITSEAYLHSGADIIVVRHPQAGKRIEEYINRLLP